ELMKISTRLSAGFGLLILLFILCTGIAVHALRQATEGMNDTVDVKMKRFALVVDMRNSMRDMAIAARNLALLSDPAQMQPEWQRLTAQREVYIQKRELLKKSMSGNVSAQGKTLLEKSLSAEDAALSTLMVAGKLGLDNRQQEATAFLMTT
ncbi:chemotaxis protein, partial [Pantoea sp. S62]|nr:chemotaxis protein [Pantoea sp. S62]